MHGMLIGCAIFEYRILCFLLVGASEQDMAKWWDPLALPWCSTNSLFIKWKPVTTLYLQIRIWRVAFLSNFAATSINLFYAATEQVSLRSRLYCLHLKILVSYFSSFLKKISCPINHQMADLYVLHLANTIVNFIWWILFFAILWKGYYFMPSIHRITWRSYDA